jgi:hypothetical protein
VADEPASQTMPVKLVSVTRLLGLLPKGTFLQSPILNKFPGTGQAGKEITENPFQGNFAS